MHHSNSWNHTQWRGATRPSAGGPPSPWKWPETLPKRANQGSKSFPIKTLGLRRRRQSLTMTIDFQKERALFYSPRPGFIVLCLPPLHQGAARLSFFWSFHLLKIAEKSGKNSHKIKQPRQSGGVCLRQCGVHEELLATFEKASLAALREGREPKAAPEAFKANAPLWKNVCGAL